jgi:hypothetical protein
MRKIYPEDLTLKQIRYLLLEKRRTVRHFRLEQFQRTGRVSPIVGEATAVNEFQHFLRGILGADRRSGHVHGWMEYYWSSSSCQSLAW